jgi:SAM-dependent methyltransferase
MAALQASFEIVSQRSRGGTLLGPLFASGCIAPEIDEDEEGRALLRALYRVEADLIASGEVPASDWIVAARPRPSRPERVRELFDSHAGPLPGEALAGMAGPLPAWIGFNMGSALKSARAADYAAPFPPPELMYHTSGLTRDRDFAQHGADILKALAAASPLPLNAFQAVLDFGIGVGRVARYFKGFAGRYVGIDIDQANLDWVAGNLPWVEPAASEPGARLPFDDGTFDAAISISVFTHIDRAMTAFYASELHRVTRPGAILFLTLHGECALARALADPAIGKLMGIAGERLEQAKATLAADGFDFAEQYTHLTRPNYRYGTTFVSQSHAESLFGQLFKLHRFVPGAIHGFQDLIVLERS